MNMNISIVGCGGMAHGIHMPSIQKYGKINVISCADINEASARSLSEKYSIPLYFTDYREMLEKTRPDAVVCLVSEKAMAGVASDILRGYPVMMEKPPGKTVKETNMICEAAKKSGKTNMVAFNRRFAPVYTKLKELMRKNEHEKDIKYIRYNFHRVSRRESNFEDTAIHAIDTVRFLAGGDFKKVGIKYQEMPYFGEKVANYYITFEFFDGVFAYSEILVSTGELFEGCEIHAGESIYRASLQNGKEAGGIEYINPEGTYLGISKEEICPHTEQYLTHGFYSEHKHFYDCLYNGKDPGNGADTALQSVAVCEALKNREGLVVF
ncbi:MAG: Gfo/Idh/MocA family oxidoreductase [Oscillospiraceae bacterium]|nr:Gfo/Idh/MocA family oxidoreductase [Oscillospiraceae bacterium]